MVSTLLPIHIVAGGLAIILGGAALVARKGAWLHRNSGLLFVYAMLTMGISGSVMAVRQSWTNPNLLGGVMSALLRPHGVDGCPPALDVLPSSRCSRADDGDRPRAV